MPKKFARCVEKVKRKSGKKVNTYAVCNTAMKKNFKRSKK